MKRSLASVVTACAAAFPTAATAGNMSLTVQGTPGSIEVRSFGFGAKQAVTFGGGGGAGKAATSSRPASPSSTRRPGHLVRSGPSPTCWCPR